MQTVLGLHVNGNHSSSASIIQFSRERDRYWRKRSEMW